jgi:hypothetical protein
MRGYLDRPTSVDDANPQRVLIYPNDDARALVEKYNITRLPVVIFSKEVAEHPNLLDIYYRCDVDKTADGSLTLQADPLSFIQDTGCRLENASDDSILVHPDPPYFDIRTGTVGPAVTIIELSDKDCARCYNAAIHAQNLSDFFLWTYNMTRSIDIDSDEGRQLITKYNITTIPTVLLRGDYAQYPLFREAWRGLGIIAPDGTAIFMSNDRLGLPYKDLRSGKILNQTIPPRGYPLSVLDTDAIPRSFPKSWYGQRKIYLFLPQPPRYEVLVRVRDMMDYVVGEPATVPPQVTVISIVNSSAYGRNDDTTPLIESRDIQDHFQEKEHVNTSTNVGSIIVVEYIKTGFVLNDTEERGASLIKKYSISSFPAVIYSPEIEQYMTGPRSPILKISSDGSKIIREAYDGSFILKIAPDGSYVLQGPWAAVY